MFRKKSLSYFKECRLSRHTKPRTYPSRDPDASLSSTVVLRQFRNHLWNFWCHLGVSKNSGTPIINFNRVLNHPFWGAPIFGNTHLLRGYLFIELESHYSRKRPRRVLLRKALPSKTAEVMAVLKDCHQRLPKWWLSLKIVIKDCRSDGCLAKLSSKTAKVMAVCKKLSSKTAEVMAVLKDCHQRLPKWWLSVKIVIED